MKSLAPLLLLLATGASAATHMTYHGGRVMNGIQVVNIYWGGYWTSSNGQSDSKWFDDYTRTVAPAPEFLGQFVEYATPKYPMRTGAFVTSITVTDEPPGDVVDQQIANLVNAQIQNRAVPQPTDDHLYVVWLPPYVKVSDETHAYGYHTYAWMQTHFHYAMIRFDPYVDSLARRASAITLSHELSETITDPDLDAWFSDDGDKPEIGDVCQAKVGFVHSQPVQLEWSNESNECIAPRETTPPHFGGTCPAYTHLDGGYCVPDPLSGCSSTSGAGFAALAAMLIASTAARARRRAGAA